MATAIDFEQRNDWIGKPENMSNNQCYALPVCRVVTLIPGVIERAEPEVELAHVSCWQFTKEELEEVVKSEGKFYVQIIGTTLFPMIIFGTFPDSVPLTEEQVKELHRR